MSRQIVLGALSMRLHLRTLVTGTALLLVALAVSLVNLSTGDFPVPVADVLRSLAGRGDTGTDFIVYELRLPRVLITLLVGAGGQPGLERGGPDAGTVVGSQ